MNYKQIIIARKDLKMSPGKLSAQVSHGAMAFITSQARKNNTVITLEGDINKVECRFVVEEDTFDHWIDGAFTKVVLGARNRNNLLRAVTLAEEIGLKEGEDFFLIRDNCYTELEPEDDDGRTLTVIGFRPLEEELANHISKKFHLL